MKHGEMAKHTLNGGKKILCGMLCRCGQAPRKISAVSVSGSSAVTFWSAALSLTTNKRNRFRGEWHIQERILFPGYVFLIARNLEILIDNLKQVIGLTRLIGTGDEIVPLSQEEIDLLLRMGSDSQLVEMSSGIIENDRVQVLSGPLKGMEGSIRKIDRHKRMAYLEVEMFGRTVEMKVGLEIVSKKG